MTDIGRSFEKLINETFENIEGVLVEITPVGWVYRGDLYGSKSALIAAIQKDIDALNNSINKKV